MSSTATSPVADDDMKKQLAEGGDYDANHHAPPPKKVIIIGAGAASIQLAYTLWKESNDRIHVTILEANNYIGGRLCSAVFHGHTVERGANWISGREEQTTAFDDGVNENPIWTLAKEIQLQGQVSQRDDLQCVHVVDTTTSNKSNVTTQEYLAQVARFNGIYEKVLQEATASRQNGGTATTITPQTDVSMRSLLEKHGWTSVQQLNHVERAVEHNLLRVWVADTLEQLSAAHDLIPGANDMDLGQDEMFVDDARGFNSIFKKLVGDLKNSGTTDILLNQQVQSIHYEPGQVKVVAKNIKKSDDDKEEVYHGDMVVSTVSLGVLQSGSIQFVPPLPDWKVAAFNEVQMFTFAKVFCKFRKRLWPADKEYLVLISEKSGGHYPLWMQYKSYTDKKEDDENLFMCYLGGDEAKRVERLSEEQVKDEIEELFSKAFADQKDDCRPVSVAVTDWSRNPRFCGSYSYFPVGAFGSIPEADYHCGLTGLAAHDVSSRTKECGGPTKNAGGEAKTTLYFAGEAFDNKFNGWVQGAYLSGQRVAKCMLDDMQRQTRAKTD